METGRNGAFGKMACQKQAFEMLLVFVTLPLTPVMILLKEAQSGVNCAKKSRFYLVFSL